MIRFFKNPFYYGEMLVNGKMYPHRYPPIITKTIFDTVQQIKSKFKKKPVKLAGKPYIYRGLMRCAQCDLAITPEQHKGHVYYHCTQYNGKHNAKWFREEKITEALTSLFKRLQVPADLLEHITATLNELHNHKVEFHNQHKKQLTKEQKTITSMLDNLYIDKLKGRITESDYDKFYTKFRQQLDEVSIKIEQLQQTDEQYFLTCKYLLYVASKAHDLFVGSEVQEKRQLLKLILQNLKIDGENIVWELHSPFDILLKCSEFQEWRP